MQTMVIPLIPSGRALRAALALLCGAALSGCAFLYEAQRQSELQACEKLVSQTEVAACRNRLAEQQKAFQREQPGKAAADGKPAKSDGCFIRQSTGEKVCPN